MSCNQKQDSNTSTQLKISCNIFWSVKFPGNVNSGCAIRASSFLPKHWLSELHNLQPGAKKCGGRLYVPNNMWKTLHLKFSTSLTFCAALRSVSGSFPLSEPAGQVDRLCQHDEPWFSGGANRWKQIFGVAVCEKHLLSCPDKLSTWRSSFISMEPTTPNHHNYRHMRRPGC